MLQYNLAMKMDHPPYFANNSALAVDYGMYRTGLEKAVRSGLWFAAMIDPYAGMVALDEWGHPVGSQMIGFVATVLAFGVGYSLEKFLLREKQQKA